MSILLFRRDGNGWATGVDLGEAIRNAYQQWGVTPEEFFVEWARVNIAYIEVDPADAARATSENLNEIIREYARRAEADWPPPLSSPL